MKEALYLLCRRGVLLAAFGLTWLTTDAWAQGRRVSGRITDNGQGIPGATIQVKGTRTGTTTNADGNYSINVPGDNATLVVSSVGFKTIEVAVGSRTAVDVSLEADALALSEVVVTGYTTDTKRETTGAVSTVKAKDLLVVPSGNVEQQLQGRVAGLTVVTNGQPGTTSQIRVRGFGAFGGNEPLYVVDGVPTGSIDFVAPDDVETTTVLKDAASASIYGARAANGVIVITTKKGQRNARKLTVNYDGLYGVTDPGTGISMLNPTDFANWTWQAFRNTGWKPGDKEWGHPQFGTGANPVIPDYINVGGQPGVVGTVNLEAERAKYNVNPAAGPIYQVVRANKEGTDWYRAITRTAPLSRHSLGFSGGGESSRFYVGLSAQNQAGILKYNNFNRYTFRVNTEFDLTKKIRIGQNLQGTYLQRLGQSGDAGGVGIADDENSILGAFRMPSIIPVYDEFGGYAGTAAKGFNNPRNPVAERDGLKDNRSFNGNAFGNIYLEIEPIQGLVLRSSVGGQYNAFYNWGYTRLQYENSENNSAFGYNEGGGFSFGWVVTNTAAYRKKFGVHEINAIVGQEALNTGRFRNMSGNGLNPFSTSLDYVNLSTTSPNGRVVNSSLGRGINFASYFARAVYTFNDKYIVTGVVRRDGSSRFGANNRYGVFPAVSAAWRLSSEAFMKDLSWITDLKVRGGYGTMGNSNNVDPNNQFSLYASNIGQSAYDIAGTNSSTAEGFFRNRLGNPDAKWETSITKNIGFDGAFFNNRLEVILDLWEKDTRDLLYVAPVTQTAGPRAAAPSVNIGRMRNRGIDIQIIGRGKIAGQVGYEATVNGGFLKNEIAELPSPFWITYINPGYRGINPIRNQVGQSISSFFGYQVVGLFQTAEEVRTAPTQQGAAPGRFRFADINGDGKIDPNDRTFLGSPVPKFSGGFNMTLTYKGFDFNAYTAVFLGNKIFNVSKWFTDFYPSFQGAAISSRVKDSWTPQNPNATLPIFEAVSNFSTNTQSNSYYVEPGGYLRLQNVSVGYTLPTTFLNRIGLQRARVSVATNNLFTITKYQGLDPSVGGNADTNFGIDVGNYPITRSVNFGLNLSF